MLPYSAHGDDLSRPKDRAPGPTPGRSARFLSPICPSGQTLVRSHRLASSRPFFGAQPNDTSPRGRTRTPVLAYQFRRTPTIFASSHPPAHAPTRDHTRATMSHSRIPPPRHNPSRLHHHHPVTHCTCPHTPPPPRPLDASSPPNSVPVILAHRKLRIPTCIDPACSPVAIVHHGHPAVASRRCRRHPGRGIHRRHGHGDPPIRGRSRRQRRVRISAL